ncbi:MULTISPECIES: DUF6476 family protein [Dinoroseobacter]|nr:MULTISPECIES: DUF6476 family protein [Dinoroseobacter]MDD9717692.1 DUF6476 family protein [Dinoroseobacter sp. PD6]URF45775.1 DUF6476 family protein [Dinoroseobacter shibae]URF50081.1 DUF6476 family protein [Dinoroseobacter shibae]
MRDDPSEFGAEPGPEMPEPANLKFLRRLVTVLTVVMIAGVVTVIGLLVIRLQAPSLPDLPESITLPAGVVAEAVTFGGDWIAVVAGDEILIYGAGDGALRQRIAVGGGAE